MLPAGRDWFQRVSVGDATTRLSTFSCAALDVSVYRVQRYCARKAVLEGLRIVQARKIAEQEVPVGLERNRLALVDALGAMAHLNCDELGKLLFKDLSKRRAFPSQAAAIDEVEEDELPLLSSNESLRHSLGEPRLKTDQRKMRKLWSYYQHWGMDGKVRVAAERFYELADKIDDLLRQSVDLIFEQRYLGMQWDAIDEAEKQCLLAQTEYQDALERRNNLSLTTNPQTEPLAKANEAVIEAIDDRPEPSKMKRWGLLLAAVIGLSLGLAFVQWCVNPLVELGDKAAWYHLLLYVVFPYLGGFVVGAGIVALALWVRLKRATDKVQDAYESYLSVFRQSVLGKSNAPIYKYYETRLDLLFRQEVVRASMGGWSLLSASIGA